MCPFTKSSPALLTRGAIFCVHEVVFSFDFMDVNLITYVARDSSLICMWSISKISRGGHLNETAFIEEYSPLILYGCTRWFQISGLRVKSQSVTNQNESLCMGVLSSVSFHYCASEPSEEILVVLLCCVRWCYFESMDEILIATIQSKATEQHIPPVLFIVLCKVVLTF